MNVITVCERSGIVRDAFIQAGHKATSNDLAPSERPGPHIMADCRTLDYSQYDLIIAFPECRYLTRAGAGKWWAEHQKEQQEAVKFVLWLWDLPAGKIAIENPAGFLSTAWRPPDQYIDPWQFGHPEKKHTGLWLKNLPPLLTPGAYYPRADRLEFVRGMPERKSRSVDRARTFPGVAAAMASQWGCL
jgi:hypothetical protein